MQQPAQWRVFTSLLTARVPRHSDDKPLRRDVQQRWLAETATWADAATAFPVAATPSYIDPPAGDLAANPPGRVRGIATSSPFRAE
jgi:hypothetical protein